MSLCQNGSPPMFLPWSNVTVTTDQKAITRGIQISMGTPPQIVSLRPSNADDNLYVVNKAQCAPQYNDSCIGQFGGVFDYGASKTFLQVAEGQWNGTDQGNPSQLSFVYFNDVLTFGNATIYGFPSSYDQPGYGGQGVMPLGSGSDFLRIAVESGAVPSTVYGLWTGSRSIDHPVDGSLVVGGYDTTRINGSLTTFNSLEQCEMCVVITSLAYEDESGSTNLFSNASESLQVNLQPSERALNVPQNVWENFMKATNAVYNDSYLTYPSTAVPTGNLVVTLQNGYKTTIPSEELFYYPRGYDDEGKYTVIDNTYQIATMFNYTNDGYVLDWGIPYMTMNYIIADYKRSQFKMAPAIRTDFESQGGGYVLQASCDPVTATATSTTSVSTGTSTATTSASASHSGGGNKNIGPIVGGVVGGVLGLILIVGGLALLFYRSRRRKNNAGAAAEHGQPTLTTPMMGNASPGPNGGSTADRYSHWTAMSPTEAPSELGGAEKMNGTTASVNQWLSSQASDTQTVVSSTSPNPNVGATLGYNMGSPQTGTMERPFEMPAQTWDTR
ncbi:hypothetical protein AYO21_08424 [Fonsecaea monophora]|uniref:Peptidase A1 domain-containing protein n=2 Tax=Fonsecaea TaxID=40354 RepID=A0A0D2ENZ9_9EURO|nr:uncharacterized protein Z517_10847 [Fonsecaea pedrosoi CBS 271.37]XP_022509299.1 hypothetical protein AYO21_08424 [Fonsecaea monophora]KIW76102.1 hypothetical protein Z517_10847 [Fonsecaea pedrosoi CBS 271.37]OAG37347.1 hypothetical protein AYO21_08424 [Fonsecaea monophora]